MRAVILAIGDELTLGQSVDTNSAWLSARLVECGVLTAWHKTVADDQTAIAEAVREAADRAELVILTGGLGTTPDDLTRPALGLVLGVSLRLHRPSLARIEGFFRRINRPMPAVNRVQALCPAGARMLTNECGTAPGLAARVGGAEVYALPGVPGEMRAMFARHIAPALRGGRAVLARVIHTFGAGESAVAELLGELMRRDRNPLVGTTVAQGVVSVRVRSEFATRRQARAALDATVREIAARLGALAFGAGADTLAAVVGRLLRERGQTLAVAESCTGGLAAKLLTDVPGASDYFRGGWVVYANALKIGELRVPAEVLEHDGAVSERAACRMAAGALRQARSDFALALTGVAGPGGGTPRKPVGTVWIGLARRAGRAPRASAQRFRFPGERAAVRERAAHTALNLLRLELLKAPASG